MGPTCNATLRSANPKFGKCIEENLPLLPSFNWRMRMKLAAKRRSWLAGLTPACRLGIWGASPALLSVHACAEWRSLSTSGNQRDTTARLLVGHGLERLAVLPPLWWNVSDSLPGGLDAVLRFQREGEGCRLPSLESKVSGSRYDRRALGNNPMQRAAPKGEDRPVCPVACQATSSSWVKIQPGMTRLIDLSRSLA
jgi:hypothetical protein